jgi:transposase
VQKLQEFDITPPPPPRVTEYQVQARACGRCGAVTAGQRPPGITGRAQYGPEAHAQAANLASAHYIPVGPAAQLMGEATGLPVSAGWMAGVRHKAAGRLEPFMDRVRLLLRGAGDAVCRRDPARAAGHLAYVHVACTGYLTAMHTGGRSAADIDAGGVLDDYGGVIVRDGYAGYSHLTNALHAWCGAQPQGTAGPVHFRPRRAGLGPVHGRPAHRCPGCSRAIGGLALVVAGTSAVLVPAPPGGPAKPVPCGRGMADHGCGEAGDLVAGKRDHPGWRRPLVAFGDRGHGEEGQCEHGEGDPPVPSALRRSAVIARGTGSSLPRPGAGRRPAVALGNAFRVCRTSRRA